MTSRAEQETTLTVVRADEVAHIYSNDPRHLRRLRKLAALEDYVTEVRGGDDWGEFRVSVENFNPLMAIRRKRPRSAAQLEASRRNGERLAAAKALGPS